MVREDGEDGRERAVLQDLVAELAGDVGEGPGDEAEQERGRGVVQEAHERGHGAAADDLGGLLGGARGDVDEHPEGVVDEVGDGEEVHEQRDEVGVDEGLHGRVGGPRHEAAAGEGRGAAAGPGGEQRAPHFACVDVHAGRALVEVLERGERVPGAEAEAVLARCGGERGRHGFSGEILGGIPGAFYYCFIFQCFIFLLFTGSRLMPWTLQASGCRTSWCRSTTHADGRWADAQG